MYDVNKLEKEWQQYRFNRRKPWYIFSIALLLLLFVLLNRSEIMKLIIPYTVVKNQSSEKQIVAETNSSTLPTPAVAETNSTALKPFVPTLTTAAEELNSSSVPLQISSAEGEADTDQYIEDNNTPQMNIEMAQEEEFKEPEEPVHKRKYLKIIVTDMESSKNSNKKRFEKEKLQKKNSATMRSDNTSTKTIESAHRSFLNSNSSNDSLFLAQKYYQLGQYGDAAKWADMTSQINSNLEESWIILAKSKAKLGEYDEAERILSSYIDKTDSLSAKSLLPKIKNRTFR